MRKLERDTSEPEIQTKIDTETNLINNNLGSIFNANAFSLDLGS